MTLLIQAAVIVGLPPVLWYLTPVRRLVPLAVFQIIAGITLGPSVLGRLEPEIFTTLFPPAGFTALYAISDLGLVVFAFVLGLHLDYSTLFSRRGKTFALVSTSSLAVPLLIGVAAGAWIGGLFPDASGPHAGKMQFAAAIGICVAVTALPVLAAILIEMKLLHTRIGQQALGYAAVNDFILWISLALLLAFRAEQKEAGSALWHLLLGSGGYIVVMAFVVRPLLEKLSRQRAMAELRFGLVCMVVFASAATTDLLGLHAILGALVAGLIVPRDWRVALLGVLEMMTAVVLLPFFFILTGLRTSIEIGSASFVGVLAIASVAATLSKIIGTAVPARLSGETWNDSLALGALMQAKGLMEVVVLSVLLEAGIIAPVTFSAMVAMAVLATILALPLTRLARALPFHRPDPVAVCDVGTRSGGDPAPASAVISALIISWNDWPKLQNCLVSLFDQIDLPNASSGAKPMEVVVIDNDSTDGTADRVAEDFPAVRLVRNSINVGHTRAVNQAFGLARGEFVLLLDSDTELRPDCVSQLLVYAKDHLESDLLSPRTFNTDGSVQETARNFPSAMSGLFGRQSLLTRIFPDNPFSYRYLGRENSNDTTPFEVQQISGACMFFRRALLEEVGAWDEGYFGYWVDTDWCHRLHRMGRRVVCVPAAKILHHESNARGKRKSARRIWIFHYGAWRLYTRWNTRGPWDPRSLAAGAALIASAGVKIGLNAWPHVRTRAPSLDVVRPTGSLSDEAPRL
jgi:Kef-type K+ transport system membrane component KefB/GT2 family glycosyltransferase